MAFKRSSAYLCRSLRNAILFSTRLNLFSAAAPTGCPPNTLVFARPDARLLISVRPHVGSKALIYFGGNAEDVSMNLPSFSQAFPDHSLYLVHYRGYGGSSGTPTEENLQQDALALFDHVRSNHADVTLVGRSLGSGVAIRLASQRPARHLILITPYASIQEIAATQFPYLPVRWLLADKFESWRYAPTIRVPTLLIAAENDEVIPRASTDELYAAFAAGVASLIVIPHAGHNTISESPRYLDAMQHALAM